MGQNKKILITKAVNYAASKTAVAVNSALNPADLADGAIGIYGIDPVLNAGKLSLITDAAASSGRLVNKGDFQGEFINIVIGTPTGPISSNRINVGQSAIKKIGSKTYEAPVKGIFAVGYHPSGNPTGSLNYPNSGVERGDEISIGIIDQASFVTGNRQPFEKERYSAQLVEGQGVYAALVKLVNDVKDRENREPDIVAIATPKIVSNGSGSPAALSATLAVVTGETNLTASAAHGIGVGDYVGLAGQLFQAVAGTGSTTLVLDRPWDSPSGTVVNADFIDLGASLPSELGLEIEDKEFGSNIEVTVQGLIQDADLTAATGASLGSGTPDHLRELEADALPMLGSHDQVTSYMPFPDSRVDNTLTYDLYTLEIKNPRHPGGDQGSVFGVVNFLDVAFPSTIADSAGANQSDFEDIIATFYSSLISLF